VHTESEKLKWTIKFKKKKKKEIKRLSQVQDWPSSLSCISMGWAEINYASLLFW
jgi:hypothetical protein